MKDGQDGPERVEGHVVEHEIHQVSPNGSGGAMVIVLPALPVFQCASGSGLSWKCAASGLVPLPPSISHGVRSPFAAHKPRPFQPAFGSSMRPSKPLA